MYNLEGKVAVITGAGRKRGMGRAIALRLAREGADVVVGDICRNFEDFPEYQHLGKLAEVESVAEEIRALGRRGLAVQVDVTKSDEVEAMVASTVEAFGRVDIMVNVAGIGMGGLIVEYDEKAWDKVMAVNAKGPFLCSRAAARQMIKQGWGGKIVTVASQAGKTGLPRLGAYSASKFAVVGLTMALGQELAPYRINVNTVCPGTVDTDLLAPLFVRISEEQGISIEEAKNAVAQRSIPLRRVETPDDVANLVAFLCSRESDYMTGQSINITGGQEMH